MNVEVLVQARTRLPALRPGSPSTRQHDRVPALKQAGSRVQARSRGRCRSGRTTLQCTRCVVAAEVHVHVSFVPLGRTRLRCQHGSCRVEAQGWSCLCRQGLRDRVPLICRSVGAQVDRLVQLLETPVFTPLRLQLLHPAHHPALLRRAPAPVDSLERDDAGVKPRRLILTLAWRDSVTARASCLLGTFAG